MFSREIWWKMRWNEKENTQQNEQMKSDAKIGWIIIVMNAHLILGQTFEIWSGIIPNVEWRMPNAKCQGIATNNNSIIQQTALDTSVSIFFLLFLHSRIIVCMRWHHYRSTTDCFSNVAKWKIISANGKYLLSYNAPISFCTRFKMNTEHWTWIRTDAKE